jgi:hypothetical protein
VNYISIYLFLKNSSFFSPAQESYETSSQHQRSLWRMLAFERERERQTDRRETERQRQIIDKIMTQYDNCHEVNIQKVKR